MRHVLMGLAAVASLATSLSGESGLGGVQSVAATCGIEEWDPPCDDPYHEQKEYDRADTADAWADTHLAAEKAAATYWRDALVREDPVTGERISRLGTPDGRFIYGSYVCDPNYGNAISGGCVPADRDYDCGELRSWGIVNIPVLFEIGIGDWMLLDDDHDGMGCEFQPATP